MVRMVKWQSSWLSKVKENPFVASLTTRKRDQVPKIREGILYSSAGAVVNWFAPCVLITLLDSIVCRSEAMVWFIVLTRVSPATIDAHMKIQLCCVG